MNRQLMVRCCFVALLGIVAASAAGRASSAASDDRSWSPEMPSDSSRREIVAQALSATVRVSARNCAGLSIGSGFVANGVLLTNSHLVPQAVEAKVDDPGAPVLVTVRARADQSDLALLDPVAVPPLLLAKADPEVGQIVWMAGHGGGHRTQVTTGRVHLLTDGAAYGIAGPLLLIDGGSAVGFSGGPVLDEFGEVVGVLQGYEANLRLTLAVPVSAVHSFMESSMASTRAATTGRRAGDRGAQCAG